MGEQGLLKQYQGLYLRAAALKKDLEEITCATPHYAALNKDLNRRTRAAVEAVSVALVELRNGIQGRVGYKVLVQGVTANLPEGVLISRKRMPDGSCAHCTGEFVGEHDPDCTKDTPETPAEATGATEAAQTTPGVSALICAAHEASWGLSRIAEERYRQIIEEGHTPERDSERYDHKPSDLVRAAVCYAARAAGFHKVWMGERGEKFLEFWPWAPAWDRRDRHSGDRLLAMAGALIAAELDRRHRRHKFKREG